MHDVPIPVFPDVASITVCPGFSDPSFSAVSMIDKAKRSLTDERGLKNSHFAYIVRPAGHMRSEILTKGVFPTVSLILSSGGPNPFPLLAMMLLLVLALVVSDWKLLKLISSEFNLGPNFY